MGEEVGGDDEDEVVDRRGCRSCSTAVVAAIMDAGYDGIDYD